MTVRTFLCLPGLAALAALAAPAALAHHSPVGAYHVDRRTVVDGELVSIVYRTPHSYLEVRGKDEQQRLRVWAIECGDRARVRQLVEDGGLRPGDRVIATGNPSRDDGAWRVRLRALVHPASGWRWQEASR